MISMSLYWFLIRSLIQDKLTLTIWLSLSVQWFYKSSILLSSIAGFPVEEFSATADPVPWYFLHESPDKHFLSSELLSCWVLASVLLEAVVSLNTILLTWAIFYFRFVSICLNFPLFLKSFYCFWTWAIYCFFLMFRRFNISSLNILPLGNI